MVLFVGLGNPGPRYAGNRHNIGFMAVDAIARRHCAGPWRRRFQGETAEGAIGGRRVLFLKPQTYMNESGRSVAEAVRFYKMPLADVVVFYDELDLPPGKLRVKVGGGNAGHNGLRSISAHVGNDYRRVRFGIGHPGAKELVQQYVLSDFAKSERGWVDAICDIVAEHAELLARGEDATFQNRVHLAMEARGFAAPAAKGAKRAGNDGSAP
ncbi:MAG: aminoacyl-tRNA hydrolase [Variibacter sp.]|nr:aminoacyl-tRNA hydrolase [Variibacter sp.]